MKSFIGTLLFIVVGVLTALIVGFGLGSASLPVAQDDEQKGLEQQIIIKFSHVVAENTPKGLAAQLFADLVERKSGGKVKVEVFPNGILYTDNTELPALISGNVQMIAPAFSKLSPMYPEWLVLDLPYAFPGYEAVEEAFSGELGKRLFQTLEKQNIKGMAFWDNGFKQVTSNKRPLIHPDDFAGQRFRIMPSRVIEAQFKRLGVQTTIMNFNDVYQGLANGSLDGQENTLSNIYSKKFYTVQKYMTISNHGYLGYAVLMNGDFWNSLQPDVQRIIEDSMEEATAWLRENAIRVNQQQLEYIKEKSDIEIHVQTPEERKLWMNRLAPVFDEYAEVIGTDLIQMVKELQKKYASRFHAD